MAVNKRRQLKIPRDVLAQMTDGNPQAIRALEKMQLDIFDLLPSEIADIIEQAASEAMQAAMIANQIRDSLAPYLQPVGVPVEHNSGLDAVSVTINDVNSLDSVGLPCVHSEYLLAV